MNNLHHIAFIMDGNGRWGVKKKKGRNFGHFKGVETVKNIVKASLKIKIPILTFYVFSSENWNRPKSERLFLFKLLENYFSKEKENLLKQGIKINILGDKKKLPINLNRILNETEKISKKNKKIIVNLAINYGSKSEIVNACKKTKKFNIKNIEKNLFTKNMPDPNILVRTGGYQRLSNFLLWQLSYAELFFLKKLWPDFNPNDLYKIVKKYKNIKRNFGKI